MSPLIRYQEINLQAKALGVVERANAIIEEYSARGFDLTLRQLFYQFVARGLIANSQREYKNLGSIINDGRLAGLIDWDSIVDRTRNLRSLSHWENPQAIVAACAEQFHYDLWEDQPFYLEVWIEKDALVGVIEGVCNRYDVPHFSCRGYTSQSEMWVAAQRIIRRSAMREQAGFKMNSARTAVILHFGDHDPSGIDMTRDVEDRLRLFGADVEVRRLALNMPQVEEFSPPPNPAKITDSRAQGYIARFGDDSWELDALDPGVIAGLVEAEIKELLDDPRWAAARRRQDDARHMLGGVARKWDKVSALLNGDQS